MHQCNGSKVTVILLKRLILPIGGVALGRVCTCSLRSRLVSLVVTRLSTAEGPNTSEGGREGPTDQKTDLKPMASLMHFTALRRAVLYCSSLVCYALHKTTSTWGEPGQKWRMRNGSRVQPEIGHGQRLKYFLYLLPSTRD